MSVISNTRAGVRRAAGAAGALFRNRAFQGVAAVLLAGALLSPLFVPFVHLAAYTFILVARV